MSDKDDLAQVPEPDSVPASTAETIAATAAVMEGPHVVNVKGLKMIAGVVSLVGLLLIAAMVFLYEQNRSAINRIDAITHPTKAQYRQQLRNGIKLCLREPECRKLFPQITTDKKKRAAALHAIQTEQRREIRAAAKRAAERKHRRAVDHQTGNGTPTATQPVSNPAPGTPHHPPTSGGGGGSSGGGGSGGSSGGGSGSAPPDRPLARTPTVEIPATPATPAVTIPSTEVPCPDLRPFVHC